MSHVHSTRRIAVLLLGSALLLLGLSSSARAAAPSWTLQMTHGPSTFERLAEGGEGSASYGVNIENSGDAATTGLYTLSDTPPPELTVQAVTAGAGWTCTPTQQVIEGAPLSCHSEAALLPGAVSQAVTVTMGVPAGAPDAVINQATISGGGAGEASASDPTPVIDRPAFNVEDFTAGIVDEAGHDYTLAGGHPFEASTTFSFPSVGTQVVEQLKSVFTELPPGFVGNVAAAQRCPIANLQGALGNFFNTCPLGSQVGIVTLNLEEGVAVQRLYSVLPAPGYPAQFAFNDGGKIVMIYPQLRPRTGGYGINVVAPAAVKLGLIGIKVQLWGIPSAHNGRGGAPIPLISNGVNCSEAEPTTRIAVDSWEHPAAEIPVGDFGKPDLSDPFWKTASFVSPAVTGCENPALTSQWHPSIETKPEQQTAGTQADQPMGLNVALDFPQSNDPTDLSTVFDPSIPQAPELKDATVTLPAGVSISPSSAAGLGGCSDQSSDPAGDQVHYDNTNPATCPDSSKIGTLLGTSPLLAIRNPINDQITGAEPLPGDLYVLKPHAGDLPPGGHGGTFRVLLQVEDKNDGINVKVPGTVVADPTTGQLTATFTENPQLPVKHLDLTFKTGPRAPLATPTTCGTFTTTTDMVPWSTPGTPDAHPTSAFQVTAGANNAACPATPQQRPFAPGFSAGTESATAGASAPFVLKITRNDGEQEIAGLNLTMPPGFTAKLAGIPYCSEQAIAAASTKTGSEEQANPSCPLASQVGSLTTGAGPGTNPYYVNGNAYLAGPYKGAPLSLVFFTPAVAGPFDLGSVVVRAAVFLDKSSAQVTVKTDPIPTIVDGVPLRVRSIVARIDRPGFALNPTNCNSMAVAGEAISSSAQPAALSNHFQVGGCAGLKFNPKFTVSTVGQSSKANGASLTAKVSYPYAANGAVNLTKVKVELPRQLPSRLTTLQKACTSAQFDANPAGCPSASFIGHATVHTPLLPVPLTGPAIFVSHGGEAFPSLVVVLQGYGITVNLVGTTFISKTGVTSTTFKTVPDVPFTDFELTLPQGPFSALAANLPAKAKFNFCGQKMIMPTELIAQNGAAIHQNTVITPTGCAKKAALTKAQKLAAALKACKKKHKGKRAACARAARRQFATAARTRRGRR
jgi:hypothetical protein